MHKVLFPLGVVLLLIIGIWAALLFTRQTEPRPQVDDTPFFEETPEPTPDEIISDESAAEASATAEASTEAVPELNPAKKTNPFSGTYKNPFAK